METTSKTTGTSNQRTASSIEKKAREAEGDIQEAWTNATSAIESLYTQATNIVQEQVRERPYAALAAAAGIGFVLGGGLRSVTGRYLLRTTAQLVVPGVVAALRGEED
ncbi:MAG TPA: hypothetical protein VJR89_19565 [Polyangiales bacterium]|nr:hypothetical protein [Polyangiales bacterium]